jgi:fructosamine-3-kinase
VTRQPAVARRAESLLGAAVVATAPVAGGDIATATKLRLSDGTTALMKTLTGAPAGFFAAEAAGLRWLAEVDDGVPVPHVLAVDDECLVIAWVDPGKQTADEAADLGRRLAATHAAGADGFGRSAGLADGFIGRLPMANPACATWAELYAEHRLLPYLRRAADRAALSADEVATIEAVVPKLAELVPEEPPARLHGDLWTGNVLWGQDGRAWLVDPAAHGGHRETDLAMLALFGLPNLPRVLDAYDEATPLAEGWQDRAGVHQLFPLLVHACLFGGGYGARAADVASRYT